MSDASKIRALSHCGVCLCRTFPGSVSGDGAAGPSPELLACLQSLGDDDGDYTLLPHSLHQVCVCVCVRKSRSVLCVQIQRERVSSFSQTEWFHAWACV